MPQFPDDNAVMRRAIELARQGLGAVEPNPPVGAVIVDDDLNLLGEGYHQQFGGPHAEIHALEQAGDKARRATLFVTLEPCCHEGKTPPCSRAVIDAGLKRVVVAIGDPSEHVNGGGIRELRDAGIQVETGLLEQDASLLAAPFIKLLTTGVPFVHAKWAMTLDGKIASRARHSQWISNEKSREKVHELRGRMDAILVGATTARLDDPLLTARPSGPRTATRIVIDRDLDLPMNSQLLNTAQEVPLLIATCADAIEERGRVYSAMGAELISIPFCDTRQQYLAVEELLKILGQRQFTNVLIEGGGSLLGDFFDRRLIDAVHVFLAPKLLGGFSAVTPVGGGGLEQVPQIDQFVTYHSQQLDDDVYCHGMLEADWWREYREGDWD
ncbi:MAG: bifunctional diaminohydroxyphosphoribosylaminopyrimidine deaminase/5-amino-6-(5-phosphoribosylamino)uracil reductase RibD [Planctomycetaceae bacterium]|nr:bifunctional diaminohydroxyphosphoribosylaminopyrimidine deaminase/5-amino-6-(5-phosphoribosylamino)uracil reductase RibD [Planctomycetaceae bacterium]